MDEPGCYKRDLDRIDVSILDEGIIMGEMIIRPGRSDSSMLAEILDRLIAIEKKLDLLRDMNIDDGK